MATKTRTKLISYNIDFNIEKYIGRNFVSFILFFEDDIFDIDNEIRPVGTTLYDIKIEDTNGKSVYMCRLVTTSADDYIPQEYLEQGVEWELIP